MANPITDVMVSSSALRGIYDYLNQIKAYGALDEVIMKLHANCLPLSDMLTLWNPKLEKALGLPQWSESLLGKQTAWLVQRIQK